MVAVRQIETQGITVPPPPQQEVISDETVFTRKFGEILEAVAHSTASWMTEDIREGVLTNLGIIAIQTPFASPGSVLGEYERLRLKPAFIQHSESVSQQIPPPEKSSLTTTDLIIAIRDFSQYTEEQKAYLLRSLGLGISCLANKGPHQGEALALKKFNALQKKPQPFVPFPK